MAVWLHRLTRRLGELVKLEVAATLENPDHAEKELRHRIAVFRRSASRRMNPLPRPTKRRNSSTVWGRDCPQPRGRSAPPWSQTLEYPARARCAAGRGLRLASELDRNGGLTARTAILGTPHYLAPEALNRGSEAQGVASDVYALGVIRPEMLTSRTPFAASSRVSRLGRAPCRPGRSCFAGPAGDPPSPDQPDSCR